jgi:DNA-directed RNA polymerase subunit RPC12/RpoP
MGLSFEKAKGIVYVCAKCGARMKSEDLSYIGVLECLECGYDVLKKTRPETVKMTKAR